MKKRKKINLFSHKRIMMALGIIGVSALILGLCFQDTLASYAMKKGQQNFTTEAYDLAKAERWYKIAGILDRDSSHVHFQMARIHFVKGDFANAEKEATLAVENDTRNDRAYYTRGLIRGFAKDYEGAEADFAEFVSRVPNEWAGYNDLAWVYYQSEQYDKAKEVAEKGLEKFPDNAWLLNGLGATLIELGDKDGANAVLAKARANADQLTERDWQLSYPSNDPQMASAYLAKFQNDVQVNYERTRLTGIFGKPAFQAACAATVVNQCNGNQCVPAYECTEELDHLGYQTCFSSCSSDAECCVPNNAGCAANTCVGQECWDGCKKILGQKQPPNAGCAAKTCKGQTCSDGCNMVAGTMTCTCQGSSPSGDTVACLGDNTGLTSNTLSWKKITGFTCSSDKCEYYEKPVCGPAAKQYRSTETVYVEPFCSVGIDEGRPSELPKPGKASTWKCKNGESVVLCTAKTNSVGGASVNADGNQDIDSRGLIESRP